MRLLYLAVLATVMPFVWGWLIHLLIGRIWPERRKPTESNSAKPVAMPFDYQI